MEMMLDEIRATFDCGIWYPVVSSVLMLPDACGAVEFWGQGKHSRDRYQEWYNKWVYPDFSAPNVVFDGAVVYIVRNAMIHESTGFARGKHGFDRVMFMPPNKTGWEMNFNIYGNNRESGELLLQVTIRSLMDAVENGVRKWLSEVRSDTDDRRIKALGKLIQYRANGDEVNVAGVPVIS